MQNPRWINLSFIGMNGLCNLTHLTDTIRWQIIRRWDSQLLRCISDEGLCTHVSILRERKAEPFPGRIVFFRPRRSWIRLVGRTRIGMSWHKIARDGLEVHRVPGAHNEMLRGRQGKNLCRGAEELSETRATRRSRTTSSTSGVLGSEARCENPVFGFSEAGPDRRGIRLERDGAPSSKGSDFRPGRNSRVGRVRRGGTARNGRIHQSVVWCERLSRAHRQLGAGRPCGYRRQLFT